MVIGPASAECDNSFDGVVSEALFTTGTLRYRIKIGGTGISILVRIPSHPGEEVLKEGTPIQLGWDVHMSTLLATP